MTEEATPYIGENDPPEGVAMSKRGQKPIPAFDMIEAALKLGNAARERERTGNTFPPKGVIKQLIIEQMEDGSYRSRSMTGPDMAADIRDLLDYVARRLPENPTS